MAESSEIVKDSKKKLVRKKYIIGAVVIFLSFLAGYIYMIVRWELKADPESEKIFRETAAHELGKEPNELTDEDFSKITRIGPELFERDFTITSGWHLILVYEFDFGLTDIKFLEKFTNLQELNLNGIHFPITEVPKWTKILNKIGKFNFEERVSIDLRPLKKLNALKTLRLSGSQISDITSLKRLLNLEVLFIDSTLVSDLEPLRELKNLKQLSISGTRVSDLEPLKELKNLKQLTIGMRDKISDEQINDLRKELPNLNITTTR